MDKLKKVPVPKAKTAYKRKSSRWRAARGDSHSYPPRKRIISTKQPQQIAARK